MSEKEKPFSPEKTTLHPRNKHRFGYDFDLLIQACPELKTFVSLNQYQNQSIDFSNPKAVKTLNKALLKQYYGIDSWDIPPGYLCPPIPGRADYIHYLADLLKDSNGGKLSEGKSVKVLDVGTGANLVYPLIGHQEYGWSFIGSDIDSAAIASAKKIIAANSFLKNAVELRLQKTKESIFKTILKEGERIDLSLCNPPFHTSAEEAQAGTKRKWENLGAQKKIKEHLNFGGQNTELWCEGGERLFAHRMIQESVLYGAQCLWFSTLISKSANLPAVYGSLEKAKALEVKTIEMAQGNKISRIVAWTFLNKQQQKDWNKKTSL